MNPSMPRVLLVLLVLPLGGCGLAPKVPLAVVDARTDAAAPAQAPALPLQLEVGEPQAIALLDSRRLAVREPSGQMARLAGVSLPDRAPRWLQSRLLDALAARPFASVAAPGSALRPDLQLVLRLQRFELDYRETPLGRVALHAVLVDADSARALASARFEEIETVQGKGSAAGVEALQRAAGAAVEALADWAEASARAARAAPQQ